MISICNIQYTHVAIIFMVESLWSVEIIHAVELCVVTTPYN